MPRIGTVIRDVYRRPGAGALPAHLEDHYGIRVAAMTKLDTGVFRVERDDGRPWLACVSPKVSRAFVPDRDYIVALAGRVRDSR